MRTHECPPPGRAPHPVVCRYSQVAPTDMFTEKNTGTNLPAQIDLFATAGNEYHFQFMAKGGGSANKTFLFQKTKALLNEKALEQVEHCHCRQTSVGLRGRGC